MTRLNTLFGHGLLALVLVASIGATGCSPAEQAPGNNDTATNEDTDAPLEDGVALFEGVPGNDTLEAEGKPDAIYPDKFSELVAFQSKVQSQGRRGVCSIFATVGYMEHLYLKADSSKTWDFSEQYLQWSAKNEVGMFKNTAGSNARVNLQAIHEYGIPDEAGWPYETSQWDTSDDELCTGDDQPTRCYTNGEPPAEATSGTLYKLPRGRWINSSPHSIKAHMMSKKTAVQIGVRFYYQAWNHRKAKLPTSQEYWREGYVLAPNSEDKKQDPAGHSILLVGWDDTLEVQKRDKEGNGRVDQDGNAIMEKGFFIFKNSWGTGSFGVNSEHGDGYGYISFNYVRQYGSAYVSGVPELDVVRDEICWGGDDEDGDDLVDCLDPDCASDDACWSGGTKTYTNEDAVEIPDNDERGVSSELEVEDTGKVTSAKVTVDITHSYSGDVNVFLEKGGVSELLLEASGSDEDDIKRTFSATKFDGAQSSGTWTLVVSDVANQDTGTLNSWSLELVTE